MCADPLVARMCVNTMRLALAHNEKNDALLESEQLHRQIAVLKKQHARLIDDNHAQYLLLQQKEKEYAKELEDEIARQTTELRATNRQLEAASRLKSDFLANMSHELRTPLNAVIGFSDLILQKIFGDLGSSKYEGYISDIKMSAQHLLSLINEILDVSKAEAGKLEIYPTDVDVDFEITNTIRLLKGRFSDRNFDITKNIDPTVTTVRADPRCFRQILLNIMTNAVKFCEENCRIEINVAWHHDQIRFSFRDNGIGIPKEKHQDVFKAFYMVDSSLSRKTEGTGLGLSITKTLVELHDGAIEIDSAPGSGTTVSFELPGNCPGTEPPRQDAA
jgi:two-component system cell cycle sensor histidine kinase PleC